MINFGLGFVAALIVIQFYPPVANVGKWIVDKAKSITG
jgi:hypothetical protein